MLSVSTYLSTLSSIQMLPVDDCIGSTARCAAIPISIRAIDGVIIRLGETKCVTSKGWPLCANARARGSVGAEP